MESEELLNKIQASIANGETEEAISTLLQYTKSANSPLHEDAVLLSGQFRQWERGNMLGIEQSSHELNRIQMGILDLLKGNYNPDESANDLIAANRGNATQRNSTGVDTKKIIPIAAAIFGVLAVIVIIWLATSRSGNNTSDSNEINTNSSQFEEPVTEQPSFKNTLEAGETLNAKQKIYSANGQYYLEMQTDGNAVIYDADETPLWASQTYGNGNHGYITLQTDGNLVLHRADNEPLWSSKTHPFLDEKFKDPANKPVKAVLENTGALVLYNAAGKAMWSNM